MTDLWAVVDAVAVPRGVGAVLVRDGWWIAAMVAFSAAVWAGVSGWWRRRAATALADRVVFELLPASTFEADPAEVRWFAGQVASVRAASGALPRRASAARIRVSCEDNQVHYLLEGPARARSLLRMPGYQDVEVVAVGARSRASAVPRIHFEGARPAAGNAP